MSGGLLDIARALIKLTETLGVEIDLPYLIGEEGFAVFMNRNDTTFNE